MKMKRNWILVEVNELNATQNDFSGKQKSRAETDELFYGVFECMQ